jgi:hypothetical protein
MIFGIKLSTLIASFVMAVLAVVLDIRRHSLVSGLLAVVAGMAVAGLATEAIITGLGLPHEASYAVAGVLGISGRNIVIWITLVSKDPLTLWERIRGSGGNK